MAKEDYIQNGVGAFCSVVKLNTALTFEDTTFTYTEFNFKETDGVAPGMAGMIDNEIVRVESVGMASFVVKRGCADTVPDRHAEGALCWMFSEATGTNNQEYGAGDTIGVKPAPFTTGGGAFDIDLATPDTVAFNFRFFRPYAPGQLRVNGQRWHLGTTVTESEPNARVTWVHRDRILQANQLLGHDDPSIGPEPGVTYTVRVRDSDDKVLREEPGIIGQVFTYQWAQMVADFGYPTAPRNGHLDIRAVRQGFDSFQWYSFAVALNPAGTVTSQYMAFASAAIEAPYQQNLVRSLNVAGNYVIGMAARPSDRMSDSVEMLVDAAVDSAASGTYTPHLNSEFRLPQLETTFNIRSSSSSDGVLVAPSNVGRLALIDEEIVQIAALGDQVTILRGCLDTVPAVHAPGARMWFFEQASETGTTAYGDGEALVCRFRPRVYGPPVALDDLPTYPVAISSRSMRPYPPGQVVINGRPWFEEIAANSGGPVVFSWARRNRITQAGEVFDHAQDDVPPEDGQLTRLTFYYTTPATAPGGAPVEHVLREVNIAGTSYDYTYDLALLDGQAAGTATGTCGTVAINVSIYSVRGAYRSYQGYRGTLRLPSYPCAG